MRSIPISCSRALATGALAITAILLGACDADELTAPLSVDQPAAPSLARAAALTHPTLPQATVDIDPVAPTGRVIRVPRGGSVQAAIDAAMPGDVVMLEAGATFTGNFHLPKKSGNGWVTIRTSTPDGELPAPGQRIAPAQASRLATLASPNGSAALATRSGAHHYRIIGLELIAAPSVSSSQVLLAIGDGSAAGQSTLAQVPSHIVVERSYIHGRSALNVKNCVVLHGAHTAIVDSYLSDCHSKRQESHGIIGWNGPGPFRIENNFIEAGHIHLMFGGADPANEALMPSDVVIRRNHFTRPLAWRGVWAVKNLLEFKIGRRILVEGNVFENNWVSAQSGFALLLKTHVGARADAYGRTEDVTIRYNLIRNAAAGINIASNTSKYGLPTRRIRLEHNVWDGIGVSNGTKNGRIFQVLPRVHDVQVEHNTALHSDLHAGALVLFGGGVGNSGFVFRDNVTTRGSGVRGNSIGEGMPALDRYAPGALFSHNVIAGAAPALYPTPGFFPATTAAIGFVSPGAQNYRLAASSPYRGRASDGTDPGADIGALNALIDGVVR